MAVVAIVGGAETSTTNATLAARWRAAGIQACWLRSPAELDSLQEGDVAVARIDVRPTLDGIEPGLFALPPLQRRGVRVVNEPRSLIAAHDKAVTVRRLVAARLPHPSSVWVRTADAVPDLKPPVVVKPRFGSWGKDVFRCDSRAELEATLAELEARTWFRRLGTLVQQLVPSHGHDLRLLVAGGRVAGAIRRRARPGEWRTNYSLGGTLERVVPPRRACALAVAAAAAIGADFVGVDLLPVGDDWVILELNGAVDFEPTYALAGQDVYEAVASALSLPRARVERPAAMSAR